MLRPAGGRGEETDFFRRDIVRMPEFPVPSSFRRPDEPLDAPPGVGDWRRAAQHVRMDGLAIIVIPSGARLYRSWARGRTPVPSELKPQTFLGTVSTAASYAAKYGDDIREVLIGPPVLLFDMADPATVRRIIEMAEAIPNEGYALWADESGPERYAAYLGAAHRTPASMIRYAFEQTDAGIVRQSTNAIDNPIVRTLYRLGRPYGVSGYAVDSARGLHDEIAAPLAMAAYVSTNWMRITAPEEITYYHGDQPVRTFHLSEIMPPNEIRAAEHRPDVHLRPEGRRKAMSERQRLRVYNWYRDRDIPVPLSHIGEPLPAEADDWAVPE